MIRLISLVISSSNSLVLASASPRRAKILSEAGFTLTIQPSHVYENGILQTTADVNKAVMKLALFKASAVIASNGRKYVLGADTIVLFEEDILGKPESPKEASKILNRLSGQTHEVITGVAIVNPEGLMFTSHVRTSVNFKILNSELISSYVSTGAPFDKAGGYGIQDSSFDAVESYDGCYLNVVGLPMCAVANLLEISGFQLKKRVSCQGHLGAKRLYVNYVDYVESSL